MPFRKIKIETQFTCDLIEISIRHSVKTLLANIYAGVINKYTYINEGECRYVKLLLGVPLVKLNDQAQYRYSYLTLVSAIHLNIFKIFRSKLLNS